MGFWSISLYGNDLTLDVRDKLDDLLKSGVSQKNSQELGIQSKYIVIKKIKIIIMEI